MQFVLKPSLEHMVLVKIGISLWNQNDVRALISKLSYDDLFLGQSEWKKTVERVTKKVPQLLLPHLLKEKVFGVIRLIGFELLGWMQYYLKYDEWIEYQITEFQSCLELNPPAHVPAELCWTQQGTLDRKRTAEVLVRDEKLNVSRRYILACDYFLEDDVIQFWNRLPEVFKEYDWSYFPVIRFWSDNMKREDVGYITYKDLFYSSVRESNKVAAEYFLQKLTPREREKCIEKLYVQDANVLRFLLSEMQEEEQKKVLQNNPQRVLQCFLQWPWQSVFMGVANCMWDFLPKNKYREILVEIITKVKDGYKDYNYQKLFREFWQKSPSALKDSLVEIDGYYTVCWLLICLFDIKDEENFRLILKDTTLTAKAKFIYSEEITPLLNWSIRENKWDFLKFIIRECLPSKNRMLKFKKNFEMRSMLPYFKQHFETKKQEWDQLFYMSDVPICKYDKRRRK